MSDLKPPRYIRSTLAVGQALPVDGPGRYVRLLSTTGTLSVGLNLGTPIPNIQVGQAFKCEPGQEFQRVVFLNPSTALASVTFEALVGDVELVDTRLALNLASNIPVTQADPNFAVGATMDSTPVTAAASGIVQLLAADATRREAWLWTDSATNAAWFAESAAQLAAPLDFQRVGMTIEGFTKIRTRSAVYVKAADGVKVGAIVFKA